jgi:hypothetical protein
MTKSNNKNNPENANEQQLFWRPRTEISGVTGN